MKSSGRRRLFELILFSIALATVSATILPFVPYGDVGSIRGMNVDFWIMWVWLTLPVAFLMVYDYYTREFVPHLKRARLLMIFLLYIPIGNLGVLVRLLQIYKIPSTWGIEEKVKDSTTEYINQGEDELESKNWEDALDYFNKAVEEAEATIQEEESKSPVEFDKSVECIFQNNCPSVIQVIEENKREVEKLRQKESQEKELRKLMNAGVEAYDSGKNLSEKNSYLQAAEEYLKSANYYKKASKKAQSFDDEESIEEINLKLNKLAEAVENDCLEALADKVEEVTKHAWENFRDGEYNDAAEKFTEAQTTKQTINSLESDLNISSPSGPDNLEKMVSVSRDLSRFRAEHNRDITVRFEKSARGYLSKNTGYSQEAKDAIDVAKTALEYKDAHKSYPFESPIEALIELFEAGDLSTSEIDEYRRAVEMSDKVLNFLAEVSHDHPSVSASDWKEAVHTALENGSSQVLRPPVKRIDRMGDILWDKEQLHVFSPEEFEHLVGTLYEDIGYESAVTQKSSDAGVDVWAQRNGETAAIQVKQNSEGNTVGRPVLQKISSTIAKGDADQAVVVTSSSFANTAETYARDFGTNMELIDGDKLVRMLSESDVPPPVAGTQ
jgi:restriction endonuclease Mrr